MARLDRIERRRPSSHVAASPVALRRSEQKRARVLQAACPGFVVVRRGGRSRLSGCWSRNRAAGGDVLEVTVMPTGVVTMDSSIRAFGVATHVLLGLAAILVAPQLSSASPDCATQAPEDVVRCFAQALEAQDVEALGALLASDFTAIDLTHPGSSDFDRESLLSTMAALFQTPNLDSISIAFGRGLEVVSGDVPETWLIKEVPWEATFHGTSQDGKPGPYTVEKLLTFEVRRMSEPRSHYVIVQETSWDPGLEPLDGERVQ